MGVRSTLWTSRIAAKSPSVSWPSRHPDAWRNGLGAAQPSSRMLRRHRRFFALLAFGLLATPLVVGIVRPDGAELVFKEGRRLAPPPNFLGSWRALPGQIDAYLKDHFGFRHMMI